MELPRLSGTVALDLETHDPALKKIGPGWCFRGAEYGKIVGIALAWDQGSLYLPIRHETGTNLNAERTLAWLRSQLEDPSLSVVYHNGVYDRGWLRREGIVPRGPQHDTESMAAINDEYRHFYNLNSVAQDYLGEGKDEAQLNAHAKAHGLNPKTDLWRLPGHVVEPYALQDARLTLGLFHYFHSLPDWHTLETIYRLEMRLQAVLVEMRWRGVRVDLERADRVRARLLERERESVKELQTLSGLPVDLWANRSLGRAADKLGIEYPLTAKRKDPSFKKEWLQAQANQGNTFAALVLAGRKASKLRSTFIEGHLFSHAVHGRIHSQFHPLRSDDGGAVTGRFSSSDPNLQNLPNKEEEQERENAILVRGLFLPEEGEQWSSLDYSQQEPRLALHYAAVKHVHGAAEAVEMFIKNPKTDTHQYVADLTGEPRGKAKILNLSVMYGKGEVKLCKELGLATKWITNKHGQKQEVAGEEGRTLIDKYYANVPWLKGISKLVIRKANRDGVLWTIGRRRRKFAQEYYNQKSHKWEIRSETAHYQYGYKAFNALIQGGAADQLKIATVNAYEQGGVVPLVTVHDENGCNDSDADVMYECMMDAVKLRVPTVVDRADGINWGATL